MYAGIYTYHQYNKIQYHLEIKKNLDVVIKYVYSESLGTNSTELIITDSTICCKMFTCYR